jgi:hypothetical protein
LRRLFWTAVAGVVACALAVGWYVFMLVAQPLPAQPLQASVSPDGRWQVRTWFVGREQLGRSTGYLRVDVANRADRRTSRPRTIWVDRVEGRDAGRRLLMWRDATHLVLPSAGKGEVVLDVVHAPPRSLPGGFVRVLRATAIATAALLGVAAGGIFGALLAGSWLIRREQARWEAWPVAGAEGRSRAPQG